MNHAKTAFLKARLAQAVLLVAFLSPAIEGKASTPPETLLLKTNTNFYPKGSVQYYIDKHSKLEINDVRKRPFDKSFKTFNNGDINLDPVKTPIWFRFSVLNKTGASQQFSISNDNTLMRQASIYILSRSREIVKATSIQSAAQPRAEQQSFLDYFISHIRSHRILKIEDNIQTNQRKWVYIKIQSEFPKEPRFLVSQKDGFWEFEMLRQKLFIAYFGAILAILLINLIVFLKLKRRSYLYYVIFGSSMGLNALVGLGYAEQIFGSFISIPDFARISLALPIITGIAFSRYFLQTHLVQPKSDRLLAIMYWLVMISLPFRFVDNLGDYLMTATDMLAIAFFVLIIKCGIRARREQHRAAGYFILSFSILFVAASIFLLQRHDLIARNFFTQNIVLIGQVFELLVLSVALIEDYKELEKKKANAEAMANESLELRTLVRVLSHDIVNPVAIIKGHADIQLQIAPESKTAGSWGKVLVACKAILDLVQSVRDMRSLKEGKLKVQIEPVRIKDLIEHLEFTFKGRLLEKHLALNIINNDLEDRKVKGNASIIKNQILNNIVSNAIKFSLEGGRLDLKITEKGNNINIELRDYGIGIPESILVDIFDPTTQTTRPGTLGESGTGYGMPLVKSFVERFGGIVQIDSWTEDSSPEDCGTRVVLSLPEWKASRRQKNVELNEDQLSAS